MKPKNFGIFPFFPLSFCSNYYFVGYTTVHCRTGSLEMLKECKWGGLRSVQNIEIGIHSHRAAAIKLMDKSLKN